MLSDEEKEIFNNLKEYMQNQIDNGYHKFIYNDLDWDFKCIDCINAIDNALKQSKEIEEYKKQLDLDNECEIALNNRIMDLEKEIEELKDTRSVFNIGRRSYKNEIEDKIKAKIEELEIEQESNREDLKIAIDNLLFQNIDKIGNRISINMSIRGILQSLLEKE